jgi:hypothetical protein
VIVADASNAAFAAKGATTTIPIVFSSPEDPVGLGLVASLARPDGNLTGINWFASELSAKRLELLRELVPGAARVAVLVNPANATSTESTLKDVLAAAGAVGLQTQVLNAGTGSEINAALATFMTEKSDALLIAGAAFFRHRRVQLVPYVSLCAGFRMPAMQEKPSARWPASETVRFRLSLTANRRQLTGVRESVDSPMDERSLQTDLVRLGRAVPAPGRVRSGNPCPSASAQRAAAQILGARSAQQHRPAIACWALSSDGHTRSTDRTTITMAEWMCREADRIDPAGLP